MFSIDGMEWNLPCKITRTAQLTASEVSGMMLDKRYFNDVIGTYMTYGVTVVVPLGKEDLYSAFYEKLVDPVSSHNFVLPYNQGTIQLTARVETVSDELYREVNGKKVWRRTSFTIIANYPSKTYTLSQVVARGVDQLPTISNPVDGATYRYSSSSGWTRIS